MGRRDRSCDSVSYFDLAVKLFEGTSRPIESARRGFPPPPDAREVGANEDCDYLRTMVPN